MGDTLEVASNNASTVISHFIYQPDSLRTLPGITSVDELFSLNSATMTVGEQVDLPYLPFYDPRRSSFRMHDQSLTSTQIRGSRANGVQYLIEGSSVTNPIYGGRNLLNLNMMSLESVEIMTGVPSARYGGFQSGVVNMQMREIDPNKSPQLDLAYRQGSDAFGYDSFNRNYLNFFAGAAPFGDERLTLSVSGGLDLSETPYHMEKPREDYSVAGIRLNGRQENRSRLNASANYQVTENISFRVLYNGYWSQWSEYSYPWLDYPEKTTDYERDSQHLNVRYRQKFDPDNQLTLSFSHLSNSYNASVNGRNPAYYWTDVGTDSMHSIVGRPELNHETGLLDSTGVQDIWHEEEMFRNTFEMRFVTEELPYQTLEIGLQHQTYDLDYTDIIGGAGYINNYGRQELLGAQYPSVLPPPAGPYKYFGMFRSVFNVHPEKSAAYLQNRINLESVIIDLGIRLDRYDRGSEINDRGYRQMWRKATGLPIDDQRFATDGTFDEVTRAVSPRATIRYPFDVGSSLYFSYGHFNQMPELQYLYWAPTSQPFVGNPKLDFIKTEMFEFGWNQRISSTFDLSLTGYHKESNNLPRLRRLISDFGETFLYTNRGDRQHSDGADVRIWGGQLGWDWNPTSHLSFTGNYTLQWANGFFTNQSAFVTTDFSPRASSTISHNFSTRYHRQERPLAWNARHRAVAYATLSSQPGDPLRPFGLNLPENWSLSLIWRYDSGLPYTQRSFDPTVYVQRYNKSTTRYRMHTDLKFSKGFTWGGLNSELFVEIFNLFNRYNPNPDFGFNRATGEPWKVGDMVDAPQRQLISFDDLRSKLDPRRYQPGFRMQLGIRIGL